MRIAASLPKRYTFYISEDLVKLTKIAYQKIRCADRIHPRNKHESQIRRDYLQYAIGIYDTFVGLVEIAEDMSEIDRNKICKAMELVDEELNLLDKLMKKDLEQEKKLKS